MKKLFSLIIVILHVLTAVVAVSAEVIPGKVVGEAPLPTPRAASTAADINNENGNTTVEKGQTVRNATATNGNVTVLGHVTGNATATNGSVYVRSGGKVDGNATATNGKVVKDPGGVVVGSVQSSNGGSDRATNIDLFHDSRDTHRVGSSHKVGNDVVIAKGQTINEATAVQGDVIVYGHVTGSATAVMGNVYVKPGGKVDRDAVAVMGRVVQSPAGTVGGEVTSLDLGIPRHAWWSLPGSAWWTGTNRFGGWLMYVLYLGGGIVLSALLTAVVIALFPQRMTMIAECSMDKPGWSLLYGVVGAMLVVPIALLLLVTCIGIPLIAVEAVLVVLLMIAGGVGVELGVGRKTGIGVGHPIASAVLAGVVGSVLMGLLELVPFVGGLVVWTLYTLGAGAALMTGFGASSDWFPRRFDKSSRTTAPQPVPAAQTPYAPPPAPPAGPVEGE